MGVPSLSEWTEGRKKSFIVSTLRAGNRRWPPKYNTLNAAKTEKRINVSTGRLAQHYKCAECLEEFPAKVVQVNHKEPVVPLTGFTTWDDYINRMFCDDSKLEVLCIPCHKKLTLVENNIRKEFKTIQEKGTYQSWLDMKSRCLNPSSGRYYTHGGRGISVCPEWADSYDSFKESLGLKPDGFTLERIDNDGNYEPSNCKWASPKEQAQNRRSNINITHDGTTMNIQQWADSLGISHSSMKKRLLTMSVEEACTREKVDSHIENELKQIIMTEYALGELSQTQLAKKHGVSQAVISKWFSKEKKEKNARKPKS